MNLRTRKYLSSILLGAACCLLMAASPQSQTSTSDDPEREYRIKSAFLYHFLHYGEWARDGGSDEGDLVVCIAGDVPHVAALETLGAKRLNDRAVSVRLLIDTEDAAECRIAFFGASVGPIEEATLLKLRDMGVLTVGETAAFTNRGGMIRLYKHRNRLRFEINLEALRSAGIHMSSRVLQLATIV